MLKWMYARMTLTAIFMEKPGIPKKHLKIIKCYPEFMAELFYRHPFLFRMIQEGCLRFGPERVSISFCYAFLTFAFFADGSACHITMTPAFLSKEA